MSIESRLELEELPQEPEIILFSRVNASREVEEALLELDIQDPLEKKFLEATIRHGGRVAGIANVKGVLVRLNTAINPARPHINFLTAYNLLRRGNEESTRSFQEVSLANADFAKEIKDFGSFGSSSVESGDDFDEYLNDTLLEESKQRIGVKPETTGNAFKDMAIDRDPGYTTIAVLKFE